MKLNLQVHKFPAVESGFQNDEEKAVFRCDMDSRLAKGITERFKDFDVAKAKDPELSCISYWYGMGDYFSTEATTVPEVVEGREMRLYDGSMEFTALLKYDEVRLTSDCLLRDTIKQIADGVLK